MARIDHLLTRMDRLEKELIQDEKTLLELDRQSGALHIQELRLILKAFRDEIDRWKERQAKLYG